MNIYRFENPRYGYNYQTTVKCSAKLNEFIRRNWSREDMCKIDDFTNKHIFSVDNEQLMDNVMSIIQCKNEYNELLSRFIDVDAKYREKNDELNEIKSERKTILAELKIRRAKLNQ
jgi:hypothetical protein